MRTNCKLVALLVILLGAGLAQADALATARAHFNAGKHAYQDGDFWQAISEFQAAYRAKPHPSIFFNIAQCYERLQDWVDAVKNYQLYLDQMPHAKDREAVQLSIANLQSRIRATAKQSLLVTSEPQGAAVTLDGKPFGSGTTPTTGDVAPAEHTLEVSLNGYEKVLQVVTTTADKPTEVNLTLKPLPGTVLPPAAMPTASTSTTATPAANPSSLRTWSYVSMGVAAAALAGAVTFGLMANGSASKLTSATTPLQHSAAQSAYDGAKTDATVANVLYGVTAVGVAAGGTLFVMAGHF